MLRNISSRTLFLLIFLFCCGLMGVGYTMEHVFDLEPCPLRKKRPRKTKLLTLKSKSSKRKVSELSKKKKKGKETDKI